MSDQAPHMAIKSGPYPGPSGSFKRKTTVPKKNPVGKKNIIVPTKKKQPVARGTHVLHEIQFLQRTTQLQIPKVAFSRLVREIAESVTNDLGFPTAHRWKSLALLALQEASEAYLVGMLEDSYMTTLHRHRVTLQPADMDLALRLRGETKYRQLTTLF